MPTIIRGQKKTTNVSTNRVKLSFADGIALLNPNENPAVLVTRKTNKISIGARKHSWLADEVRPEFAQVAADATTTGTTITVDTATYFAVNDVWRVFNTGETLFITAVDTAGNTLGVTRNYGGQTSGEPGFRAPISDNDWLEFNGNSSLEGTTAPLAMQTLEVQYDNFTQIQRTVLRLSNDDIAVLMHGEQDLPYTVKKRGMESERYIERIFIFGGKPVAESGTTPAQSGGWWWFLRKYGSATRVITQTDITEDEFLDWVRHSFRFGSGEKILYSPPLLTDAISRWSGNHLRIEVGEKMFGVNTTRLVTPHGDLSIINHKMLEGPVEGGGTYNHAFIIDPEDITYVYTRGRDTALLTGREANDADENKQEYLTELTMRMKQFHKHGYLYGFTSYTL